MREERGEFGREERTRELRAEREREKESSACRVMREAPLPGVIWKCWSNISFRLDSAILLSASRRLPLPPNPTSRLQGRIGMGWIGGQSAR